MRTTKWTAAALLSAAVLTGIPVLQAAPIQAASVQNQAYTGVVINSVNLRTSPSTSANVITLLQQGETLTSVSESGSYWYKVTTSSGVTGYASSSPEYIQVTPVSGNSTSSAARTGEIIHGVNMRTAPSTSSQVIRMLEKGEDVRILGENDYWYQVQTSSGQTGYISSSSEYVKVSSGSGSGGTSPLPTETGSVQTGEIVYGVNLRKSPSTSSQVIRMLQTGESVKITGSTDNWYQVVTSKGENGYISSSSQYVKVGSGSNNSGGSGSGGNGSGGGNASTHDQLIQKVFAVGRSYLGTPYEYGSDRSNNNTFDCSDFTRTVYREATGVILPADSRQQGDWVKQNSKAVYNINSLKPGDLMFFMDYKGSSDAAYQGIDKSKERITHVGIYMGNGQILQTYSVKSGGVRIDNLSASWQRRFLFGGSVL